MSTTRGPLLIRFEKLFKEFADKKTLCINSSQQKLKNGSFTRVFDSFPPLLDHDVFKVISDQFQTILSSAKVTIDPESNLSIDNISIENINIWFRNIIRLAREDLVMVDFKGIHTQGPLVELFEWQEYQENLENIETLEKLLLAYYGAVYSVLSLQLSTQKNIPENAFKAVSQYIHEIDKSSVIMSELAKPDDVEEVHSNPKPLLISEKSSLVTMTTIKNSREFLFPFFIEKPKHRKKSKDEDEDENAVEMEEIFRKTSSESPAIPLLITVEETREESMEPSNGSKSTLTY